MGIENEPIAPSPIDLSECVRAEDRFPVQPVYRDKPFTWLWLAHMVVMFGLLIGGIILYSINVDSDPNINQAVNDWESMVDNTSWSDIFGMLGVVAGCGICGGLFGIVWLFGIRRFPRQMIWIGMLTNIVILFIAGILCFFTFSVAGYIVGGVMIFLGLIFGLLYFLWRNKVPFSALVLEITAEVLNHQTGNFYVAIGSFVVFLLWFILWSAIVIFAQSFVYLSEGLTVVILFILLLSWFWNTEIIKNTVHVTVSGSMASWFFQADSDPVSAVKNSLRRAVTTSYGSICFGSLLVAICQTLRAFAESRSANDDLIVVIIKLIIRCFLLCIESFLRMINKFAFTQVAIYGKSFWEAAKATFVLLGHYGVDVIMNDLLIGSVIGFGAIAGAFLICVPATGLSMLMFDTADPYFWLAFFFGFLVGLGVILVTLSVVDSAVTCLFVCICEEPATMYRNYPALFQQLRDRYPDKCSNLLRIVS